MLELERARSRPIQFKGEEYVRIGSYKKRLKDFPEVERKLWLSFDTRPFEGQVAADGFDEGDVLKVLDYPVYFEMLGLALPENRNGILDRLVADRMIVRSDKGGWSVLNLGAILFAKSLSQFKHLQRKSVRVIVYKGSSRIETIREQEGAKGYAAGFEGLIGFIDNLLPRNEIIGKALRRDVPVYPELAVRELVANSIIHQDFSARGTGPMIELFSDRMEITNPGAPLVETQRFLDYPPKSRNEALASFLRRVGVCEERGSGFDKVVHMTEVYQLPAPEVVVYEEHTKVILYAYKPLKQMSKEERVRACYLHACLRAVNGGKISNASLRERFGIESKDASLSSRIIKDTIEAGLIKPFAPDTAPRYMSYLPYWA